MSEGPRILANKEVGVGKPRPVGGVLEGSFGRRPGRRIIADVTEEEGTTKDPRGNRVIEMVGKAAQVVVLSCGVGALVVACANDAGENVDAGPDAAGDVDTDTDTDTDSDSDTDTGAPVCEHHTGPSYDHEAKLAVGEKVRLTPEGHHMEVIVLDVGNQTGQVHVTDGEGNPILNGDSDFIFEGTETEIIFDLGGEMVTITLCWVVKVTEGDAGVEDAGTGDLPPGTYAKFITDGEHGFVHCEEAEEYSATESVHTVDESTTQTVTEISYNEGETGDEECEGVTSEFHMEHSEFEEPLFAQDNIPGEADKSVRVRGATLRLLEVSESETTAGTSLSARLGTQIASGNLQEDESVTGEDLEVEYKGLGTSNGPDFAFKYPGIDEDTDLWVEETGDNERTIYVQTDSELRVFVLRFGNENWDGSIDVSLLKNVQRMEPFAVFTVGGLDYDVAMTSSTEPDAVTGWILTPLD